MQVVNNIVIPAKGIGYADYGTTIAAQATGIFNSGDWQVLLGNQKQISLSATDVNTYTMSDALDPYLISAIYNVPAAKDFWLYMLSGRMTYIITATSILNWIVELYDNTLGVPLYSAACMGPQLDIQLSQPIKALRGHQLLLNFYNYGTPGPGGLLLGGNTQNANYWGSGQAGATIYGQFTALKTVGIRYIRTFDGGGGRQMWAGILSDNAGQPGNILSQSTIVRNGKNPADWEDYSIPLVQITAGVHYWIALTSDPGGQLYFDSTGSSTLRTIAAYTHPFVNNPAGLGTIAGNLCAYALNDNTLAHDDNFAAARIVGYEA